MCRWRETGQGGTRMFKNKRPTGGRGELVETKDTSSPRKIYRREG